MEINSNSLFVMNILFLQTNTYFNKEHQNFYIKNNQEYLKGLLNYFPDIIIADKENSSINWNDALDLKQKHTPLSSFILTGIRNDEDTLDFLKAGVDEYVSVDEPERLNSAVYSAAQKRKLRLEKKAVEQSLKDIFENNPAPKFIVDPVTQKFIALNKAGENYYGYSKKEFLNMRISDLNALPVNRINSIVERVNGNKLSIFTVPHKLKNGEIRYVELFISLINYEGKECHHCIVFDVTEKRAAQKKLIKEKNKAEELNKLKNDFMASMSHEIRNPLFGILSNAEFLNNSLKGEYKEEAENLYTSAITLFKAIEKMLKFSDIKVNPINAEPEIITERNPMQENHAHKVLIVEDELINMLSLKKMLFKNHSIFTAKDAETALNIVNEEKIEAILMDINLKADIDGVQLTNIIRKLNGYGSIPIIAMTAYAFPGEKERFLSSGFTHYISKPFSSEQLIKLMEKVFSSNNGIIASAN